MATRGVSLVAFSFGQGTVEIAVPTNSDSMKELFRIPLA
jgi:hypothetical protein